MTIVTHRAQPSPPPATEAGPAGTPTGPRAFSWIGAAPEPGADATGQPGAGPDEPPARGPGRPPVAGPPPSRWRRSLVTAAAVVALAAGGGTGGAALAGRLTAAPPAAVAAQASDVAAITGTGTDSLAGVAATVSPSIVTVFVADAPENGSVQAGSAVGSGVVLSADGMVLTNNHVVDSGGTLSLRLSDGRTVPARLVAADATHDLALIQGTGLTGLTPATFGADSSVAVGDPVLAFGSPLGLEGTVTAGIVSAVDRSIDTQGGSLDHLVQTDAPINAGNSGGALVDTAGRVVGINVAIATTGQDGGSIGVGFAVPADTVTLVVRQLLAER